MKNFDPATLTALAQRAAAMRLMLRFDLPEGTFGFWNGLEPITYESVLYNGAGSVITVDDLSGVDDPTIVPITLRLNSIPNTALTPDVLGHIFDYQWKNAPAVLMQAYFNPATAALIMVERITRRRIDTIEMEEMVGGQAQLIATLQPVTLDNPGRGFLVFGDADQRLIAATDGFFSFAATAGEQTIEWGRAPKTSPGSTFIGGSGFARG